MAEIKIVHGAPLSGKSTYVKKHFSDGDLRYDYDEMKQCIGLTGTHEEGGEGLRDMLLSLRAAYLNAAHTNAAGTAWLICTRPSDFIKELAGDEAEYIHMDVTREECYKRLENDDTRPDKDLMRKLIDKYFDEEEQENRSMPIKDDREYRNLGTFIKRDDDADEPARIVEGYAATYDRYALFEEDGVTYYEQIAPDAFKNADLTDVVFLRDHTGRAFARTKNGSVEVRPDEKGLYTRTDLSLTEAAREMYDEIATGLYTQMSWSFVVDKEHYEKETRTRVIDAVRKIYDISAVIFPANPYTDIGISARSLFNGAIEQEKAERLEQALTEEKERLLQRIKRLRGEE